MLGDDFRWGGQGRLLGRFHWAHNGERTRHVRLREVEDFRQRERQLQKALRPFTASSRLSKSVRAGVLDASGFQTLGPAWRAAPWAFAVRYGKAPQSWCAGVV